MEKTNGFRIFLLILTLGAAPPAFAEEPTSPSGPTQTPAELVDSLNGSKKLKDAAANEGKVGKIEPFVSNRPMQAQKRNSAMGDLPQLGEIQGAHGKNVKGSW
jgi:hypothetical protein